METAKYMNKFYPDKIFSFLWEFCKKGNSILIDQRNLQCMTVEIYTVKENIFPTLIHGVFFSHEKFKKF